MSYLNHTCYTSLHEVELHFAVYPPGAYYKRHIDQFRTDSRRKFSVICYLNETWSQQDAGELILYLPDETLTIHPAGGRLVFFESGKIEHEVMPTRKERLSITGWMKSLT